MGISLHTYTKRPILIALGTPIHHLNTLFDATHRRIGVWRGPMLDGLHGPFDSSTLGAAFSFYGRCRARGPEHIAGLPIVPEDLG